MKQSSLFLLFVFCNRWWCLSLKSISFIWHVLVGFPCIKTCFVATKKARTDVWTDECWAEVLLEISFGKVRHHLCLWSCGLVQPKKYVKDCDFAGGFYCFDIRAIKAMVWQPYTHRRPLMATINRNDVICRTAHQQPKFNAIIKERKQFKNYI